MKYLFFAIPAMAIMAGFTALPVKLKEGKQNPVNTLSKKEKQEGWKLLFDGNSTHGWHSYLKNYAGSAWTVTDGSLHLDNSKREGPQSTGGGDLTTDGEYENFDLKIEWKISKNGNSGILFDIKEDPKYSNTFYTGPEMQVLDNEGHSDGKIIKHRAGDLYDLISCSKETVRPVGEWNQAEIKIKQGKLDLYRNGTNVVSTTLWDDNWKTLVKGSKFVKWPDFSTFKSGHIALQDHGNEVWFRNIKIKAL